MAWAPSMSGRLAMAAGMETAATAMATLSAHTPSPSAPSVRTTSSPGTLSSAPPPSPRPTAAAQAQRNR